MKLKHWNRYNNFLVEFTEYVDYKAALIFTEQKRHHVKLEVMWLIIVILGPSRNKFMDKIKNMNDSSNYLKIAIDDDYYFSKHVNFRSELFFLSKTTGLDYIYYFDFPMLNIRFYKFSYTIVL